MKSLCDSGTAWPFIIGVQFKYVRIVQDKRLCKQLPHYFDHITGKFDVVSRFATRRSFRFFCCVNDLSRPLRQQTRQEIRCLCKQLPHYFDHITGKFDVVSRFATRRNFRFFCCVNDLSRPLRQQMFISKSSKGYGL